MALKELTGLDALRAPVQPRLHRVMDELRRIAVADYAMVDEVNDYLLAVPASSCARIWCCSAARWRGGRPPPP